MKVAEIIPYNVMDRFPTHRETIKQLFYNNPNFQTLCTDYHRCSKALQFWKKSPLCEAPQRRQEYETLLAELESEILQHLEKAANLSGKNTSNGE